MAVVRIWPGGSSGGFAGPGRKPDDGGAKRGEVNGWSKGAARRLLAWLWSVDAVKLEGRDGWAVTLTMGGTPEHSDVWALARKRLLDRLRYDGVESLQWLTEWTAKGRPHMHMAVYGPGRLDARILVHWLTICDDLGWPASTKAQHIVRITGTTGWLQYLSKHAARGVAHYQRQGAPPGWEKTGRLWGVVGDWPIESPLEVDLERHQFHAFRRHVRRYQKARMRSLGVSTARIHQSGVRLRHPVESPYIGVSGWIPEPVSTALLELAYQTEARIDYRKWD